MSPLPQRPPIGEEESNESKLGDRAPTGRIPMSPPSFTSRTEPAAPEESVFRADKTQGFSMPDSIETPEDTELEPRFAQPAYAEEPQPVVTQQESDPEDSDEYEELNDEETLIEEERKNLVNSLSEQAKQSARLLLERISDEECSEVLMNGPRNIMVKINGNRLFLNDIYFDSVEEYHTVINTLILHDTDTLDRIGSDTYLIEGQLELPDYDNPEAPPLFARVHVISPPVVKAAKVTIAKKAKRQFKIDDLAAKGAMSPPMASFLKAIAKGKATTVFSGLSGAGKTTLLEAMSYEFDENDRVVVVEDTAELRLPIYDVVPLLATSRKPGQDNHSVVTLEWLVAQANRMRPDRIIVGEARGGEFSEFLTAANSGADGSMTTIHASSTKQAVDKMRSLAMKSSANRNESSIVRDISSTIQIIVQMSLIDGRHVITQIDELSDIVNKQTGEISIQPIFAYDRSSGRFLAVGRPSEKLSMFLAGRGVNIDISWFSRI